MKFISITVLLAAIWLFSTSSNAAVTEYSKEMAIEQLNSFSKAGRTLINQPGAFEAAKILVEEMKSCGSNVAFALDGSASISPGDFKLQKEFVEIVTAIASADDESLFAATQYGITNYPISDLEQPSNFIPALGESTFVSENEIVISAGLKFCISQLERRPEGEPKKIVILGDGMSAHAQSSSDPTAMVQQWREMEPGNVVYAVAVGIPQMTIFEEIVLGDSSLVLIPSEGWGSTLSVLQNLVTGICAATPRN